MAWAWCADSDRDLSARSARLHDERKTRGFGNPVAAGVYEPAGSRRAAASFDHQMPRSDRRTSPSDTGLAVHAIRNDELDRCTRLDQQSVLGEELAAEVRLRTRVRLESGLSGQGHLAEHDRVPRGRRIGGCDDIAASKHRDVQMSWATRWWGGASGAVSFAGIRA